MTSLCFLHPPEWFQMQVLFSSEHSVSIVSIVPPRPLARGCRAAPRYVPAWEQHPRPPGKPPLPSLCSRGRPGRRRDVFTVSYYLTLISIKLESTAHSLGFEWSKSFFVWQPGLLLFMVLPHLLSSAELEALCEVPSAK